MLIGSPNLDELKTTIFTRHYYYYLVFLLIFFNSKNLKYTYFLLFLLKIDKNGIIATKKKFLVKILENFPFFFNFFSKKIF